MLTLGADKATGLGCGNHGLENGAFNAIWASGDFGHESVSGSSGASHPLHRSTVSPRCCFPFVALSVHAETVLVDLAVFQAALLATNPAAGGDR